MNYDLVKPCDNCPFRRAEKAIRLTEGRVEELCDSASSRGREFACHKTVDHDKDMDEDGQLVSDEKQQHCAGALIFGLKNSGPHQMGRIVERIGMWDPRKHEPYFGEVFDDVDEMKATAWERPARKKPSPKKKRGRK